MERNHKIANRALLTRYKSGDRSAFDSLVESNFGLVTRHAYKWAKAGVCDVTSLSVEDLIQEGVVGLMTAIERWDPAKGELSTIANPWIIQSMQRAVANQGDEIRVPVHVHEDALRIRKAEAALAQDGIHEPTDGQLADATGLPLSRVVRATTTPRTTSLSTVLTEDGDGTLEDLIEDQRVNVAKEAIERIDSARILALVDELADPMPMIVRLHLGLDEGEPLTFAEIGDRLVVSRQRVHQLYTKALDELRATYVAQDGYLEALEAPPGPQSIQEEALPMSEQKTPQKTLEDVRNEVELEIEQHRVLVREHLAEIDRLNAGLEFVEQRLAT